MDTRRDDESRNALASATGRRAALGSLGASGLALLAALGFTRASAKGSAKRDADATTDARVQTDQAQTSSVQTEALRRPFRTKFVVGQSSSPLGATSSDVGAVATCGERGTVVSCGYHVFGSDLQVAGTLVGLVASNATRSQCSAALRRVSNGTAGATIQANAVCLVL
jgi:hypothetical protein